MGGRRDQRIAPGAHDGGPASAALARCVDSIGAETLAGDVVDKARLALVDFLACAFEARERPWCRQAVGLAEANSGRLGCGTSSIVGHRRKAALGDAVLANAVLGHGLVRDDMHVGSVSHLGAHVMPVALGLAELTPIDGRRFVAAVVAGYEAGARMGRLILDGDVAKIHRPSGITGPFAAAATAARLLGLDADATASAFALAANTTAGFNEWAASGGDEMFFHAGFGARSGLNAAELASRGARASRTAVDGPAGLLAAFDKPRAAHFEPGAALEITNVFFKQVPACNYAQAPAQAALAVASEHAIAPEGIEHVVARVSRAAADYPGCDAAGPFERELAAKMSIQYNVAAALARGGFDAASYEPAANADICTLAGRVEIVVDDAHTRAYPARQSADVTVHTVDGRALEARRDDVEPAAPGLVRGRLEQAAERAVGTHAAASLLTFLDGLESSTNAGDLLVMTVPGELA